jgi:hypothetical protein
LKFNEGLIGFPGAQISPETQGTWQYKAIIVVGMLTDQVYPARGEIQMNILFTFAVDVEELINTVK